MVSSKIAGEAFAFLFMMSVVAVVLIVGCIGYGGYKVYDYFWCDETMESKTRIIPTIKLETDGKTIDTIYVYAIKK